MIGEDRTGIDPARDRHVFRLRRARSPARATHAFEESGRPGRAACRRIAIPARGTEMPASRQAPPLPQKTAVFSPGRGRLVQTTRDRSGPDARFQPLASGGLQSAASRSGRAAPRAAIASFGRAANASRLRDPSPRISDQSDEALERFELLEQLVWLIGRISEDLNVAVPVDFGLRRAGFLEDAMKIAAAEAECADGRTARIARSARATAGPRCSSRTASGRPPSRSIGRSTLVVGGSTL